MSNENGKYRFGVTTRTAFCKILMDREDVDSNGDCVDKKLPCSGCLIAQGFEENSKLTTLELIDLQTKVSQLKIKSI